MNRKQQTVTHVVLATASLLLAPRTTFAAKPVVNYDESKVGDYMLPNPLVCADGRKIATGQEWRERRRPEILELFRAYVYGRAPGRPDGMTFKPFDLDTAAFGGKATRKQVTVNFLGTQDGPTMDLLIYLPNAAARPVPAFLVPNFRGNHAVSSDPAIRLSKSWISSGPGVVDHRATQQSRGSESPRFPIQEILSRGYGLVTLCYNDIDPDFDDGFKNGVHGALDRHTDPQRRLDAWGAISAWAWGLSRALDYLETDRDVNAKAVVVMGHSRLGKTALWAGAQDERFAIVISNDSGCGGAALSRRNFGETVESINTAFPHWFCADFRKYNGREHDLPVDQHMLIALIAPRPAYVASAEKDRWADPRGEFLAAKGADPVYRLLGTDGLAASEMPAVETPVMSTIGYHIRTGAHDVTTYDWQRYLDFADKHLPRRHPLSEARP